jgi:hypothetical protein
MPRKKKDPESEAAVSYAGNPMAEREAQERREQTIANVSESIGSIKAMNFMRSLSDITALMKLKELKESKRYKEIGITWEQTCESMGLSRRTVDEKLTDLRPFRDDFLANFASFVSNDFNKIKYLGEAVSGKSAEIRDNAIVYGGEVVPLTPKHRDEVQGILDRIQEDLGKRVEEQKATIRAKDRVLGAKQKVIQKMEKALGRYEKQAEGKGLTPEEDAFLQQVENLRTGFDGYMLGVEPERIDMGEEPTLRMIAAYLSALSYMRQQVLAAYDTAVEMYGSPVMNPEEALK